MWVAPRGLGLALLPVTGASPRQMKSEKQNSQLLAEDLSQQPEKEGTALPSPWAAS